MSKPNKKAEPAKPGSPEEAAKALAKIEPELAKLTANDLLTQIALDIPLAVSIVLGAEPHIRAYRQRIVDELPKVDIAQVDKLLTYALAAWYAHLLALPASSPQSPTKPLLDEASPLREGLLVAAEALAHRKFLDPDHVASIRSGQGHIDTANDLVALSALFTQHWNEIQHKTAVEWSEVERAAKLGPELLVALGAQNQPVVPEPTPSDPKERRLRAFSLLHRAYDQCRRAVSFLVWGERDLEEIAPSIYKSRGAGRKPAAAEPENPQEAT